MRAAYPNALKSLLEQGQAVNSPADRVGAETGQGSRNTTHLKVRSDERDTVCTRVSVPGSRLRWIAMPLSRSDQGIIIHEQKAVRTSSGGATLFAGRLCFVP